MKELRHVWLMDAAVTCKRMRAQARRAHPAACVTTPSADDAPFPTHRSAAAPPVFFCHWLMNPSNCDA